MGVYAQHTWYIQMHGSQWHGTVAAATAEEAIDYVWELLDGRVGGRGDAQVRSVERKDLVFLKAGSV